MKISQARQIPLMVGIKVKEYLFKVGWKVKRATYLFPVIIALSFIMACSSVWEPSDSEALHLVENYYLFSRAGKEIDAEIIVRGEFVRECKCFPVKFKIMTTKKESFEKKFYFFKNEAGIVEVSEYKSGLIK